MITINYSNFRKNLATVMEQIDQDSDVAIVTRATGQSCVLVTMSEYESWKETEYLYSTRANRENLERAKLEAANGEGVEIDLDKLVFAFNPQHYEASSILDPNSHKGSTLLAKKQ